MRVKSRYSKDPDYWISCLDKYGHYANHMAVAMGIPVASIQTILARAGLRKQSRHGKYSTDFSNKPTSMFVPDVAQLNRNAKPHDIDWSEAPIAKLYGVPRKHHR